MTDAKTETPKKKRYRRTRAELDALRVLARTAALRGEGLASIRARLCIPENTLTVWARQDGYRQQDLQARAEAAAARGEDETAVAAIRQQADELWEMTEEMADHPVTGARRQVELARARTLALVEAGYLEAAEEEIASIRQLARLLSFGRAGTGRMQKFQIRAALMAEDLELEAILHGPRVREAADEAAVPPEATEEEASAARTVEAILREAHERAANRNPWLALVAARKKLAGESSG